MIRTLALGLAALLPLAAAPEWRAPRELPFGQLSVIELVEGDPARPPLPRPGDDKLGPLLLRGAEPTPDGRGWRLTVQPLRAGLSVIPALDLGDGRITPELRLQVPRTTPYGAPWRGYRGGQEDQLPLAPFPWAWASLPLLPLAALGILLARRWRARAPHRHLVHARHAFARTWPPPTRERAALDHSHQLGRDLLAARFGEEARAWGPADFAARGLQPWVQWSRSLDAARFGQSEPPFPEAEALLKHLEGRP